MKARDIILQLRENLPRFTDLFSEWVAPDNLAVAGNVVTVTKAAHGLADGHLLTVTHARVANPVDTVTGNASEAFLETANNHDLTEGYQNSVRLESLTTPAVDGNYRLLTVPGRKELSVEGLAVPAPADLTLKEDREIGINGLFPITYIDDDNFSYVIPWDFGVAPPTFDVQGTRLHTAVRVSGASEVERLIEAYDAQPPDALWAFVVLGDTNINKDRYVGTDADMEQGVQNAWNGLLLSPFSVYTFAPVEQITGRYARDVNEDVRPCLYRSLLGATFATGFAHEADSGVYPQGDGKHEYRKAYYIHNFEFQQVAQIANSDTLLVSPTGAWRDLRFDFINVMTDNGEVIVSTEVDFDENA